MVDVDNNKGTHVKLSNQPPTPPDLRYTGITIPYVSICDVRGDSNLIANAIATKAEMDRNEKQANPPMWFYIAAVVTVATAFLSGKRGKR
jgi:hypothetical protein